MVFVVTGMSLFAVGFSWVVKRGINFTHFGGDDSSADGVYKSVSNIGFTGGVFGTIKDIVSIQPNLFFALKGQMKETTGSSGFEYDSLYFIKIPVLIKVYSPLKLR